MSEQQFNEEMSIIRNMIQRTRRETFQSGYAFIVAGMLYLISVIVMGVMEMKGYGQAVQAVKGIPFLAIAFISLIIGLWEGVKFKSQPKSYTRSLFGHLWIACFIVVVLIAMVVPHMQHNDSATWLIVFGLAFYMTGAIYELKMVQVSGVSWWIGSCMLGFMQGNIRLLIWSSMIFLGFVLPGILLNRQYRNGGADSGE